MLEARAIEDGFIDANTPRFPLGIYSSIGNLSPNLYHIISNSFGTQGTSHIVRSHPFGNGREINLHPRVCLLKRISTERYLIIADKGENTINGRSRHLTALPWRRREAKAPRIDKGCHRYIIKSAREATILLGGRQQLHKAFVDKTRAIVVNGIEQRGGVERVGGIIKIVQSLLHLKVRRGVGCVLHVVECMKDLAHLTNVGRARRLTSL